jgi:hypothetical protein
VKETKVQIQIVLILTSLEKSSYNVFGLIEIGERERLERESNKRNWPFLPFGAA